MANGDIEMENLVIGLVRQLSIRPVGCVGEERENLKIANKIFNNTFNGLSEEITYLVSRVQQQLSDSIEDFSEEIVKELMEEMSRSLWSSVDLWFDVDPGYKMLCYFKDTKEYQVGTAIESDERGTFKFMDGSIRIPDYVSPIYRISEHLQKGNK
jgi:hypothetical protein